MWGRKTGLRSQRVKAPAFSASAARRSSLTSQFHHAADRSPAAREPLGFLPLNRADEFRALADMVPSFLQQVFDGLRVLQFAQSALEFSERLQSLWPFV